MDFIPHYPPIGVETVRGSVLAIHRNLGVNINEKATHVAITNRKAGPAAVDAVQAIRVGRRVYGLKNAKDIADMEAVSKNLMHGSLTITLKVYAVLQEGDVKARIVNLGRKPLGDRHE
jgi:hypothetical protein